MSAGRSRFTSAEAITFDGQNAAFIETLTRGLSQITETLANNTTMPTRRGGRAASTPLSSGLEGRGEFAGTYASRGSDS